MPAMNQQHALRLLLLPAAALALLLASCTQFWIDSADERAYRIIRQRQQQTLGATSDVYIGAENGDIGATESMYDFTPHPIDSNVPAAFRPPADVEAADPPERDVLPDADSLGPLGADTNGLVGTNGMVGTNGVVGSNGVMGTNGPAVDYRAERDALLDIDTTGRRAFTLAEALSYAFKYAWDFQTAKEDLYLQALALMTERQLWTPQLEGQIRAQYANYGQEGDFDQAMTAVSELSVAQRLPYGGDVSARIINTLMRDIGRHTTSGENGTAILEANIPLLKGAGRVAFESRYQAERELIYSVRAYERVRRQLVVAVAGDFFDLLATKTRIESARRALDTALYDLERAEAQAQLDMVLQVEADRSRVQVLSQQNALIAARVAYETALDRFKIRIGMPTTEPIDVVDTELDLVEPTVTEAEATETALHYRLDLINQFDFVDDARRGVRIAQNNFLPALDLSGSVALDTDPNQLNSMSYNTERALWQGFVTLELPIDRREERNFYRAALIDLRRAQRGYALARDNVRLDVRAALRNLELARRTMEIQYENMQVNARREELARYQFQYGELTSNRDVFEASNDLQAATNQYAQALAEYRLSVLSFLFDTGTLRVNDDGYWVR